MISSKYHFIFVHIGRTGGSSIERLAGVGVTRDWRTAHTGNTDFPDKHATFEHYYNNHSREFASFFKFTIIRNPYDRLVSAWLWRNTVVRDHRCSLYDFALTRPANWDYRSRLQLPDMSFAESTAKLDFMARFEQLHDDMRYVCDRTGLDFSKLLHTNRTANHDYRVYYDERTMNLVSELYGFDIAYFGYSFDPE